MLSRLAVPALAALAIGCAGSPLRPAPPEPSPAADLCASQNLDEEAICVPTPDRVAALAGAPLEVLALQRPDSGTSNVFLMWARFSPPGEPPVVVKTKWKPLLDSGDGLNNSPRRQIAAYAVQQLFLEPDEQLVPPVFLRCIPVAALEPFVDAVGPTFDGTACQAGTVSLWIDGLDQAEVWDEARFREHDAYREQVANLNLFTFLVDHRDSRSANFLIAQDPFSPRLFVIDNDLAFSGFSNPVSLWNTDWSDLFVPALSARHVERLRGLERESVEARLRVVAELAPEGDGLVQVSSSVLVGHADQGVRFVDGHIQFGLTDDEIDELWGRIQNILTRVDAGVIDTF